MSRRFFIESKNIKENKIFVEKEEFHHLVKVLRHREGEMLIGFDNTGKEYECEIETINKDNLVMSILKQYENNCEAKTEVCLCFSLLKGDKLEWLIQKITELGLKRAIPFISENTVVKSDRLNFERINKIILEATKQSGRAKILEMNETVSFDNMLEILKTYDLVIFAYENEKNTKFPTTLKEYYGKKVAVIIGGEGGFNESEVEKARKVLNNILVVGLGNRILRAETAGVALASVTMENLGEW